MIKILTCKNLHQSRSAPTPTALREEIESVLTSVNVTDEDCAKFDHTITKFITYFSVQQNVIHKRVLFNQRDQHSGETAEQYII